MYRLELRGFVNIVHIDLDKFGLRSDVQRRRRVGLGQTFKKNEK